MAVIRISNFGGEQPSTAARNLSIDSARTAINIDTRTKDFRPLPIDLLVSTAPAGHKKLARLSRTASGALNTDMTTNWITDAIYYDSVQGQISDDKTGRSYYTTSDGSNVPGVIDALGVNKPLGVPVPSQAVATITQVSQYTPEQDAAARITVPKAIYDACVANFTASYLGAAPVGVPSAGVPGWLAHGAVAGLPTTKAGEWAYLAPMIAGGSGYVMQFPEEANALLAPGLAGKQVTYAGNVFWAVPVGLQGRGYTINRTALITALQAIPNPATGSPLFTDASGAVDQIIADYAVTKEPQAGIIAELNTAISTLTRAYNAGAAQAVEINNTKVFFEKPDVVAEINAVIAIFAAGVVANVSNAITPAYAPIANIGGVGGEV
jgi:hypothetical protein